MLRVILIFLLVGVTLSLECPEPAAIGPRSCEGASVTCLGPLLTNQAINRTFPSIEIRNNGSGTSVEVERFDCHHSALSVLSLLQFRGFSFKVFNISDNKNLRALTMPDAALDDARIAAESLIAEICGFQHNIEKGLSFFGSNVRIL